MEFTGIVFTVTQTDTETKFLVTSHDAKCRRDGHGKVVCTANPDKVAIEKSMPARFAASWSNGTIEVLSAEPCWLNAPVTVNWLVRRVNDDTLGPKSVIRRIVDTYGEQLFSMTAGEFVEKMPVDLPDLVTDRLPELAKKLFAPIDPLAELRKLFRGMDVDARTLLSIYNDYPDGESAVKAVKDNPYQVCLWSELGIGIADALANRFGWKNTDFRRIEGSIAYALADTERNGHTYLDGKDLVKILPSVNARTFAKFETPVTALHLADVLLQSRLFVITDDGRVSFCETKKEEEAIAKRLSEMKEAGHKVAEEAISRIESSLGVSFGKEQRNAFYALDHEAAILTGAPGTGKTMVTNGILRLYDELFPGSEVVCCAPTGRAAKRMTESTGRPAETIHKLLGIIPGSHDAIEHVSFDSAHPLSADFIVVDEVSMLSTELFYYLLNAMKEGTKLLLIGDDDQLPSVSCGNCLYDMIESNAIPVFRLRTVYRQAEGSGIFENARRCMQSEVPLPAADFSIVKVESEADLQAELLRQFDAVFDDGNPYNMQMIEPTNSGVRDTNQRIHYKLYGTKFGMGVGDKVMFLRNVYTGEDETSYVNGEFGTIVDITPDGLDIASEDGITKHVPNDDKGDVTLAYACTVHKFQGSEADTIIIGLSQAAGRLMNRNLLYTAMTRARKRVIMIVAEDEFHPGTLEECVHEKAPKRNTRLGEYLAERRTA